MSRVLIDSFWKYRHVKGRIWNDFKSNYAYEYYEHSAREYSGVIKRKMLSYSFRELSELFKSGIMFLFPFT